SESIENIDKQLYVKYNLTGDEIAFIERMIKSME
ncbi:MAG: type II restriction endonuclease, partial [Capnocytophaga sp.]